jgi:hypothetical protein
MKITKREMINGLEHDINNFETELAKVQIGFWHLGEWHPKFYWRARLRELKEELNKIRTDKTYRPWND